jgi:hypothetical protein
MNPYRDAGESCKTDVKLCFIDSIISRLSLLRLEIMGQTAKVGLAAPALELRIKKKLVGCGGGLADKVNFFRSSSREELHAICVAAFEFTKVEA